MGQMVRAPPWLFCQGQQFGAAAAQPSQGNSSVPPLLRVMDATCGTVQVPIRSMPPVNRATGAPVVVVISTSTVLSVEATVPEDIVIMPIPDAMVVMLDMPDITELELLLERAHPTKFGMVTLTLLHSCASNDSASELMSVHPTDASMKNQAPTLLIAGTA